MVWWCSRSVIAYECHQVRVGRQQRACKSRERTSEQATDAIVVAFASTGYTSGMCQLFRKLLSWRWHRGQAI